jgi:outer membrane translocation and assembly module TamA
MDELEQAKAEIKALQKKVDTLEGDNFTLREKRRELEKSVETLQARVPTDDQVVVKKEEAEVLKSYVDLGKPEELKAQLEQGRTATQEAATLRRSQSIRDAAGEQFNAKALERFLPGDAELAQQGEGDNRAWVVKQGDTTKPLADVVKELEHELGVTLTTGDKSNVGGGSNPGGKAFTGPNPWAAESRNLSEQGRILREDPDLAKRLQEAAKAGAKN